MMRKFRKTVKDSGLLKLFELAPELKVIRTSIMKSLFYLFMKGVFHGRDLMNEAYDRAVEQEGRTRPEKDEF